MTDTYPAVLVAADGSPGGRAAAAAATYVAARLGVPLTIVTAWDGSVSATGTLDYQWAREIAEAAETTARASGVADVTLELPPGTPGDTLVEFTHEFPDHLLVIGSGGLDRATDRLMGSVSNQVSHNSAADVLFVEPARPAPWQTFGLATDGSSTSRIAVGRGAALAVACGGAVHLVTVAKDEAEGARLMTPALAELEHHQPELPITRDVVTGLLPARALAEVGNNYDMLIIGNRGMSGPARLLGSTANKVTHRVATNLLLVNTTRD